MQGRAAQEERQAEAEGELPRTCMVGGTPRLPESPLRGAVAPGAGAVGVTGAGVGIRRGRGGS